jgi:hypothetical protein
MPAPHRAQLCRTVGVRWQMMHTVRVPLRFSLVEEKGVETHSDVDEHTVHTSSVVPFDERLQDQDSHEHPRTNHPISPECNPHPSDSLDRQLRCDPIFNTTDWKPSDDARVIHPDESVMEPQQHPSAQQYRTVQRSAPGRQAPTAPVTEVLNRRVYASHQHKDRQYNAGQDNGYLAGRFVEAELRREAHIVALFFDQCRDREGEVLRHRPVRIRIGAEDSRVAKVPQFAEEEGAEAELREAEEDGEGREVDCVAGSARPFCI